MHTSWHRVQKVGNPDAQAAAEARQVQLVDTALTDHADVGARQTLHGVEAASMDMPKGYLYDSGHLRLAPHLCRYSTTAAAAHSKPQQHIMHSDGAWGGAGPVRVCCASCAAGLHASGATRYDTAHMHPACMPCFD